MKNLIMCLFAISLLSGCSTIPSTPKPQPEKYIFQIIEIEVPEKAVQDSQFDAERIIRHPSAKITEYPSVIAGLGESVTNDRTKSVSMPEDFDTVDGKTVVKKKTCKLGRSVSVIVGKMENGAIGYHLNVTLRELSGFNEYKTKNGDSVKMPYFKFRNINTDVTQKPLVWTSVGKLSDEKKMAHIIYVRTIPPNKNR